MATVRMTLEAFEQAERLPVVIRARVKALVDRLKQWPDVSGAKPLTGRFAGQYRLRTGDYRVQFRVERDTVVVEKIGHRDKFYD